MLSFGSNKSGDSAPKFTKAELVESPKDKASKRITSKANPNVAVAELEPSKSSEQNQFLQHI
jgi:hypothetical protein